MIASCVGCVVGQLVLKKNHVGIIRLINGDISSAYAACSTVVRGGGGLIFQLHLIISMVCTM